MMARGFRSVGWVAAVGGAALACYMLSLQVATERAELAGVEARIIATKQEIRSLQTELGTRGRLSQLERWNAEVLALSAPASGQFLKSELTLARFDQREKSIEEKTAVRLASLEAPKPDEQPVVRRAIAVAEQPLASSPPAMIHRASFQSPQLQPQTEKPEDEARSRLQADARPRLQAEAKPRSQTGSKPQAQAKPAVQVASLSAKPKPAIQVASLSAKPASLAAKPKPVVAAQSKPAKPRSGLIDARLMREIGVAARAEKGQASGGTR